MNGRETTGLFSARGERCFGPINQRTSNHGKAFSYNSDCFVKFFSAASLSMDAADTARHCHAVSPYP